MIVFLHVACHFVPCCMYIYACHPSSFLYLRIIMHGTDVVRMSSWLCRNGAGGGLTSNQSPAEVAATRWRSCDGCFTQCRGNPCPPGGILQGPVQ